MLSNSIKLNKPKLSCIILSCDSHLNKGRSVLHSVISVLNQSYDDFELILIENSHNKTGRVVAALKQDLQNYNAKRAKPVEITIIDNKKSLSWGAARNKAASFAKGEVFVFLDDDTIIVNRNAFEYIADASDKYEYGFGAQRLWSKGSYFQKNTRQILKEIARFNYDSLMKNSGRPHSGVRGSQDVEMQTKTFIANFGFCKRTIFEKIGGFPDYAGYGFEDDYLMFRLYEAGYRKLLLSNLKVVHVNHAIKRTAFRSLIPYFQELIKRGYYWFHVAMIFEKDDIARNTILEPLKTLHFDFRFEKAYSQYNEIIPLELNKKESKRINKWKENNQFSRLTLARLLHRLQHATTLDNFVQSSQADFDNLAAVVRVASDNNFITLHKKTGKIDKKFEFVFTTPNTSEPITNRRIIPKQKFNQFPCDNASKIRRVELIKERYPFAEYIRLAFIGDDDLISLQFKNDFWAWPIVFEKDNDIIKFIKNNDPRVQIYPVDVRNFENNADISVQTFMTDPPYTLHGALCFIYAGLLLLPDDMEEKEFYVILNEAMLGRSLLILETILSRAGVWVSEIRHNFSHYELPMNFRERKRADMFLQRLNLDSNALKYSSSSSLYIFKTTKPDLQMIRSSFNPDLIYEHY